MYNFLFLGFIFILVEIYGFFEVENWGLVLGKFFVLEEVSDKELINCW